MRGPLSDASITKDTQNQAFFYRMMSLVAIRIVRGNCVGPRRKNSSLDTLVDRQFFMVPSKKESFHTAKKINEFR